MKYEYRVIKIDDLEEGDMVDIPEGSLIMGKHTTYEQGYIHDPNKPDFRTRISILVPIKEGPIEM